MATDFKTIRAAIKDLIDDDAKTVQVAYAYEASSFSGDPAVVVAPSDNEADYGTTATDRVVFVFKVRAYYLIPDGASHEAAETALEAVVDELLTLFRTRDCLGSACDWVMPAPSSWAYEYRGEALYRMAEITLKCIKYVA